MDGIPCGNLRGRRTKWARPTGSFVTSCLFFVFFHFWHHVACLLVWLLACTTTSEWRLSHRGGQVDGGRVDEVDDCIRDTYLVWMRDAVPRGVAGCMRTPCSVNAVAKMWHVPQQAEKRRALGETEDSNTSSFPCSWGYPTVEVPPPLPPYRRPLWSSYPPTLRAIVTGLAVTRLHHTPPPARRQPVPCPLCLLPDCEILQDSLSPTAHPRHPSPFVARTKNRIRVFPAFLLPPEINAAGALCSLGACGLTNWRVHRHKDQQSPTQLENTSRASAIVKSTDL
ncbi:hypothetical protein VTJ04DRAFT_3281 [Mycothermus thermophilus]|uniref:uncharacterized protein n=1 Tax=Humicola insolens TaxID=85995 RepID=UPI003744709E